VVGTWYAAASCVRCVNACVVYAWWWRASRAHEPGLCGRAPQLAVRRPIERAAPRRRALGDEAPLQLVVTLTPRDAWSLSEWRWSRRVRRREWWGRKIAARRPRSCDRVRERVLKRRRRRQRQSDGRHARLAPLATLVIARRDAKLETRRGANAIIARPRRVARHVAQLHGGEDVAHLSSTSLRVPTAGCSVATFSVQHECDGGLSVFGNVPPNIPGNIT
jgi:hypothetical protein